LVLAQLFMKEARITGEHGHYYPSAIKMLDYILENEHQNQDLKFRALVNKTGVLLSLHEFKSAYQSANQAYAMNPRNAQLLACLIDANVELGNYEKAVQVADQLMRIKPDLKAYSRVAYLREIHGDVNGSIEALQLAIEAGLPGTEEHAWAAQTLAELYLLYHQDKEAKQVLQALLETRPDYPFAIAALGDIEKSKGNLKGAEQHYKLAINVIPEVGFYVQLASLYKQQNRLEELKYLVDTILMMLEEDIESGHNMNMEYASLYLDILDNPVNALDYTLTEYQKRPANIDVNRMLSKIYKAMGEQEKSIQYKQAASITNSSHPELRML
ncbi:MAG: tetratricopeptide repeat protein, partial [Bacteroidota bacterium]